MVTPELAKQHSLNYLAEHGIPFSEHLPCIESPEDLKPQSAQDVARRSVILYYIMGLGFGQPPARMKEPLVKYDLLSYTSKNELRLLNSTELTAQEKIDATWLVECMQALGWCLGYAELNPSRACDDDLASHFPIPLSDPSDFIASAKLRPLRRALSAGRPALPHALGHV